MIPQFPNFKNLELSDRADIEKITQLYPPYSDFNFVSMWSWDTKGEMQISDLEGNLAVRFTDYVTGKSFYSLIGESNIEDALEQLLRLSVQRNDSLELMLVPDMVTQKINRKKFLLLEDEDNFDYIFPLEKLATYDGNKIRSKRNLVNRFLKNYRAEVKILDPFNEDERQEMTMLYQVWVNNKHFHDQEDAKNEHIAFDRVHDLAGEKKLLYVGVYIEHQLVGFIINELLEGEYAMLHFEKADEQYIGICAFLMQENAKLLIENGKKYLNYEQDLGIPGLRLAKKSFRPCNHLKKNKISYAPEFVL